MLKTLAVLARSSLGLALSFVVVVAILALSAGLPAKITRARVEAGNLQRVSAQLQQRQIAFESEGASIVNSANQEIKRLSRAGSAELNIAEINITDRRKAAVQSMLDDPAIALAALKGNADQIATSYRAKFIEVPLADRALSLIALRRQNLQTIADRKQQYTTLKEQISNYGQLAVEHNKRVAQRDDLRRLSNTQLRNPMCQRIALPVACQTVREIRILDNRISQDKTNLDRTRRKLVGAQAALKTFKLLSLAVTDASATATQASREFRKEAERMGERSAGRVPTIIQNSLRKYGWWAFWIVSGGVLLPVLHKLFAFRIIAPLASRTRPVQIMARVQPLTANGSHTSVDVPLDGETELLVRSGVQSLSSDILTSDVLVLKKRMALTCMAAGLVNLQRLRSNRLDYVTVTAPAEDHAEVALINIPRGGAVVLQPRALVGVLKQRSDTLRIERPWRLNFLISWITFQFRYVVFHGPCSLIVQGSRGVRVDEANSGRIINKRLTLGFDAGLLYGASRSASFLPYLRGVESLFNDRFTGDGSYLYEQRPQRGSKGTIWGRGLKGLGDAALSALGI